MAARRRAVPSYMYRSEPMVIEVKSTSRDKVCANRTRLRKLGLRPVQIWVPDVRTKAFSLAAHRQSLAVAKRSHAVGD